MYDLKPNDICGDVVNFLLRFVLHTLNQVAGMHAITWSLRSNERHMEQRWKTSKSISSPAKQITRLTNAPAAIVCSITEQH